ncbi:DUF4397 domain-containing protein [Chitinophaga sp.]|uniref:DUF4397 domain-containing protein n=1 Tax=Chitinophaga sp. TaxID=1869181 RepID=UPI0031CE52E5
MKKLLIVVLGWLIVTTACKKNSDSAIPVTSSSFMFFNGVPDKAYDIWLDSAKVGSKVIFGQHTPYQSMRAQLYTIYMVDTSNPRDTIRVGQINLRNKRFFSAYLGYDSANKVLAFRTLEDDLNPPAAADSMKLRVISLNYAFRSNGQAVTMDLFSQNNKFFRGLGFMQFTQYITLFGDSTYHFNFRPTDDTTAIPNKLDFPSQHGKVYTLITIGNTLSSDKFKTFTITHN